MDTSKLKSYLAPYSNHLDWSIAPELRDFNYPWETSKPPDLVFKAIHNNKWLHCRFEVIDDDVRVFVNNNSKEDVLLGDRVEIFFRKDEKMDPYYCLEIDCLGRIYDYRARWHRKFEPAWSWPAGELKIEAHKTDSGYEVIAAISLRSLRELDLQNSNILQVGLFRGKCISHGNMKWISWVKPASEVPDFHIPSAFGILRLGNEGERY
jgi:hypothetical protein